MYSDLDEEDYSGLDEINIEDYSDLDEEYGMPDYKPDYTSPDLNDNLSGDFDEVGDAAGMEDNTDYTGEEIGLDDFTGDEDGGEAEEEMDEVEIDLEEMKKEINNNIHTTLAKYFK